MLRTTHSHTSEAYPGQSQPPPTDTLNDLSCPDLSHRSGNTTDPIKDRLDTQLADSVPLNVQDPKAKESGISHRELLFLAGTALFTSILAAFQFYRVQQGRARIPKLIESSSSSGLINESESRYLLDLFNSKSSPMDSLVNDMKIMGYLADRGVKTGRNTVMHLSFGVGISSFSLIALGGGVYSLATGDLITGGVLVKAFVSTCIIGPFGINEVIRRAARHKN